jgi:integrase
MARMIRHSALESRSARLKLAIRRKPYTGPSIARGVSLLYRRNRTNGTWVVKASNGSGGYWTQAFAEADDYDNTDGERILDFFQAQDKAKQLARGDTAADSAPITVDLALKDYRRDLESRGAIPYNAEHPRVHLGAALLTKPVGLLTSQELKRWRDSLLGKIAPASINRLLNGLCAALELAAQHDERIQNRSAWNIGLAGLPNTQQARNIILDDAKVSELVAAAYAQDPEFGLLVDTLAVTGARTSQAARLKVEDLDAGAKPRLMMPRSGKGGGRLRIQKKAERFAVPITAALAVRLKQAAQGRSAEALLLVRSDGSSWDQASYQIQCKTQEIVAAAELGPEVTLYALRHSSIVRLLLKNVPIRLVAALHDTSVSQIEKNYSKHISEFADDHARAALLQHAPLAANVVPLVR